MNYFGFKFQKEEDMDNSNLTSSDDEASSRAILKYSPLKIKNLNCDINLQTTDDDLEENDDKVKSVAIVKSSSACRVEFRKLDSNTNLNKPPQNWLCPSVGPEINTALHTTLFGRTQEQFTSFRIAHMFANYVGKVDVVADAEVIKSLLKIPYYKGPVSVIVHRIGNTLLIDNFNVKQCLLQIPDKKEFEELRRFLGWIAKNNAFSNTLYVKSRCRKKLQEKSLVSKFLCYSVSPNNNFMRENIGMPISDSIPDDGHDPYAHFHKYNRNVYWKFESLKMLIGTDMPIFGQGTHPCISLRLHDMNKPISVLTGIDYWLDNLMCNVPEVAMCYHLNGIVQNYELIKTEDLPGLENSQFSSSIIADIAKNILTFLKSNATKAGHTYWLFKPNNQEVVKLYDLTSLCSKNVPTKDGSPFIVPVAMLLYRCACSIQYSSDKHQPSVVRMLLENCVELLNKEKYPEIVTSSHFMLAELYIPFDIVPQSPIFRKEDSEQTFDDDLPNSEAKEEQKYEENQTKEEFTVNGKESHHVQVHDIQESSLSDFSVLGTPTFKEESKQKIHDDLPSNNHRSDLKSSLADLSIEDRCSSALHHIAMALDSLQYFQIAKEKEEEVVMAKPSEAIPMPYQKLSEASNESKTSKKKKKKDKKESTSNNPIAEFSEFLLITTNLKAQPLPAWKDFNGDDESWRDQLKMRLYEKSKLVYATLVEYYFKNKSYGAGLRCLGMLVRCNQIGMNIYSLSNTLVMSSLFTKAGDYCTMYAQEWSKAESYQKAYSTYTEQDEEMIKQLEGDEKKYSRKNSDVNWMFGNETMTLQQVLEKGIECYTEALGYQRHESIYSKLGNAFNELGRYFLDETRRNFAHLTPSLCKKAKENLDKALINLKKGASEMSLNCAFVYCNIAHLHRILAALDFGKNAKLDDERELEYNSAISNYRTALKILDKNEDYVTFWEQVRWDLTSTEFTKAFLVYEHVNSCEFELVITQDVQKALAKLEKCVSCCNVSQGNPYFVKYQERLGKTYLYMATLKFLLLRKEKNHDVLNLDQAMIKRLYNDAACCFCEVKEFEMFVWTLHEKLTFFHYLSSATENLERKIFYLKTGLQGTFAIRIILQCNFKLITDEMANVLLQYLENIKPLLQKTLLNLLKLVKTSKPNLQKLYGECYRKSLYKVTNNNAKEAIQGLFTALEQIETDLQKAQEIV